MDNMNKVLEFKKDIWEYLKLECTYRKVKSFKKKARNILGKLLGRKWTMNIMEWFGSWRKDFGNSK